MSSLDANKIIQSSKWFILFYPEWNEQFNTNENIKTWLLKNFNVKHYAFILHDRDKFEDGTNKKPHYHLYLEVNKHIRLNTIARRFGTDNLSFIELAKSTNGCLNYLLHRRDIEKTPYNFEEIVTDIENIEQVMNLGLSDTERLYNLLNDYMKKTFEMSKVCGDKPSFSGFCKFAFKMSSFDLVVKYSYFVKSYLSD